MISEDLIEYFRLRPETSSFLPGWDLPRALADVFVKPEWILPKPYKIFFVDESQPPILGFPVVGSPVLLELDSRLDRWLADEVSWLVRREQSPKDRAQQSFTAYISHMIKLAENAMLSNLLSDYHAVFWLLHSTDLARHFSALPKRIAAIDAQAARTQADAIKYRIFAKWSSETKDQMTNLTSRLSGILDGEEERGAAFFRTINENVLILTEEFIGPDLRELRSFITGYVRRDFSSFKDVFEKLRTAASELPKHDRVFRESLTLFGLNPEQPVPVSLLLDRKFQRFFVEHPTLENQISRENREQLHSVSRRLLEYGALQQLRRAVTWMNVTETGEVLPADNKPEVVYSKTTRPMDFGRPGVVDPMVHRFGLVYDITSFSETLGDIARSGRKGEVSSYRQMLLFQRKLEVIAHRHRLQFEKFLGDGAFYTTRRALRLVKAAIEIQRFYAEMRRKGFAFNKGVRVAVNFGYYRLLPMKGGPDSSERIMEFYGPGIVELSRLTTGKATKEIEEIQEFLVAHGYEASRVQQFFAPLSKGADMVDHEMHQRPFYAYVNSSGHLVNEGIVASVQLMQELSTELITEGCPVFRLQCPWGTYVGFEGGIDGVEYVGARILGQVQLKGLSKIEVSEIVPFATGETTAVRLGDEESCFSALRQDYLRRQVPGRKVSEASSTSRRNTSASEMILCAPADASQLLDVVLMGEWDPRSDEVRNSVRISMLDLERFLSVDELTLGVLEEQKDSLQELYRKMAENAGASPIQLGSFRQHGKFMTFVLGATVEQL